ncbi:MAG: hypothetical protein E7321_03320 [Clostridiales bacterium]|nr:hypothetical protein [Clostridiales bacterium]
MRTETLTAHVRINARIFRRFALFDTFRLKRRWISPAVFSVIFLVFSFACMASGKDQAQLIGTVLQFVGIGLPLCYVLAFLVQVHDQCKRLGLKVLRPAYTLNFADSELRIINDMAQEPEVKLAYTSLHGVWRGSGAYYIYAAPARAFILPDGQYPLSPAQMWDFFKGKLKPGTLHGRKP